MISMKWFLLYCFFYCFIVVVGWLVLVRGGDRGVLIWLLCLCGFFSVLLLFVFVWFLGSLATIPHICVHYIPAKEEQAHSSGMARPLFISSC